jgi:MerR family redox-sensitive transcriptional activator SoxR
VARESGVSASAVRFYETHGLITAARTTGNQRRFDIHAACRVKVARVAQRIGLTIAEIRAMLDALPPNPSPDDWFQLQASLAEEATRRIAGLHRVLDDITSSQKLCES